MPWLCCSVSIRDDVQACPRCGERKADWTVRLKKTRLLTIGRAWIEVQVVDEHSGPLVGAPFLLELPDGQVREGALDDQGMVAARRITTGTCRFHLPAVAEADLANASPPPAPSDAWVEVRVVDDDGRPLAGQPWRVELPGGEVREGTLDGAGELRLIGIPGGRCRLSLPGAEVTGVGPLPVAPDLPPAEGWLEVTLVDEAGRPRAGEKYRLELPGGEVREGTLDDRGTLREVSLPPGRCRVCLPEVDAAAVEGVPTS